MREDEDLGGREDSPAERAARVMPQSPASPAPALESDHRVGTSFEKQAEVDAGARVPPSLRGQGKSHLQEKIVGGILFVAAAISVLTTIGIVGVLLYESVGFFAEVSPLDFIAGTRWTPLFEPQSFGVLPLLAGSLLIAGGAAIVAVPIGLASAIYLSEYAGRRVRKVVKPALEILAGVPSVVYGYFALTFVTPLLREFWPQTDIFNAASAAIVVGVMIVPLVSSLSEDAMNAVPQSLRAGAYALGATRFEVATRTVLPAALSGVIASFILAISRAVGETMAVAIAAGGTPNLTLNPLESVQTMTAYIVQISLGETPHGTIEYKTIFAVGLSLFFMTLIMNVISNAVLRRYREVYE